MERLMDGQSIRMGKQKDKQMQGETEGGTDEWTNRRIDREDLRTDKWMKRETDKQVNEWLNWYIYKQ
jgi:hypothetical protein